MEIEWLNGYTTLTIAFTHGIVSATAEFKDIWSRLLSAFCFVSVLLSYLFTFWYIFVCYLSSFKNINFLFGFSLESDYELAFRLNISFERDSIWKSICILTWCAFRHQVPTTEQVSDLTVPLAVIEIILKSLVFIT